jgi:hypothetical protein
MPKKGRQLNRGRSVPQKKLNEDIIGQIKEFNQQELPKQFYEKTFLREYIEAFFSFPGLKQFSKHKTTILQDPFFQNEFFSIYENGKNRPQANIFKSSETLFHSGKKIEPKRNRNTMSYSKHFPHQVQKLEEAKFQSNLYLQIDNDEIELEEPKTFRHNREQFISQENKEIKRINTDRVLNYRSGSNLDSSNRIYEKNKFKLPPGGSENPLQSKDLKMKSNDEEKVDEKPRESNPYLLNKPDSIPQEDLENKNSSRLCLSDLIGSDYSNVIDRFNAYADKQSKNFEKSIMSSATDKLDKFLDSNQTFYWSKDKILLECKRELKMNLSKKRCHSAPLNRY